MMNRRTALGALTVFATTPLLGGVAQAEETPQVQFFYRGKLTYEGPAISVSLQLEPQGEMRFWEELHKYAKLSGPQVFDIEETQMLSRDQDRKLLGVAFRDDRVVVFDTKEARDFLQANFSSRLKAWGDTFAA